MLVKRHGYLHPDAAPASRNTTAVTFEPVVLVHDLIDDSSDYCHPGIGTVRMLQEQVANFESIIGSCHQPRLRSKGLCLLPL